MAITLKLFIGGVEKISHVEYDSMRYALNLYEAMRKDAELAIRDVPGCTPANTYATKAGTIQCPSCGLWQSGIAVLAYGGCPTCSAPYALSHLW